MTWLSKLRAFPTGAFELRFQGKRYAARREIFAGGRSVKFYAEELGGQDFVSLNYYDTAKGGALRPCEMPRAKVIAFLEGAKEI